LFKNKRESFIPFISCQRERPLLPHGYPHFIHIYIQRGDWGRVNLSSLFLSKELLGDGLRENDVAAGVRFLRESNLIKDVLLLSSPIYSHISFV
jgi:hypothetical protein